MSGRCGERERKKREEREERREKRDERREKRERDDAIPLFSRRRPGATKERTMKTNFDLDLL